MNVPPRRLRARIPAIAASIVLLPLIFWNLSSALPTPGLLDYGSFVASGRAAAEGLNPYGIYPLTFHVVLPGFESWNPNLNPPVSLPLFELFDQVPPHQGFRLWWSFSMLCYAAAVGLLARYHGGERWFVPALWAFALVGFWDTLVLGQIYTPLVLAAVGAWILLDRGRPVAAGLLIGLVVAVKPNFLVWPALLFLAGHFRAPVTAGAAAAVLSVVPALIYGPDVYRQWIELVVSDENRAVFLTNASLAGLVQRAGLAGLDKVFGPVLLAGLALWAWRRKPSAMRASALGLVGAILASPIAWVHYTLFLLPVFFFARPMPLSLRVAAALLVVPVPVVLSYLDAPSWQQVTFGSIYGWAVVLCLTGAAGPDRAGGRGDTAIGPAPARRGQGGEHQSRSSRKAQTAPRPMPASTSDGR
ncbi:MAG TPA: glycosyltransferase family 87 protein [Arenibaculum sp.]|nr:glycosyltransferase family 87 protein [Arenibaculum sp.]